MSFRRFTLPEMLTITAPWATPGHPERLSLESLLSTAGMVRFIESVHAALLAVLSDGERERLGLLRDGIGLKNARHDDLARIIWFCLLSHEYLLGDTLPGRAVADVRSAMFPDNLQIVHASYRESAGRAAARIALLTPERNQVLANIPVQGSNMLNLTFEWNQVGMDMGGIQDQRVMSGRSAAERVTRRKARDRWIRAINGVINALRFEAEEHPEAERVLERVAGIQAEVRRRLRAGDSAPDDDDGLDDPDDAIGEPGDEQDALPATGAQSR